MATKLVSLWRAAQVELQGNTLRVLLLLLVTPLPCFLLILIVDAVPLRPISEGIESSQLFFVRAFVCFWIASITAYGQIKHMAQPAPLSNVKNIYLGGVVAGVTVSAMYAIALVIGYPLPFGIVTVSPVWVHLLLAPLLSWMKKARADPAVWTMCINLLKITVFRESLVFIYPTYFHFFTTVPDSGKTAFSLLLPVVKIVLRGVLARMAVHLKDEVPQIVVINVDLFKFVNDDQRGPSKDAVASAIGSKSVKYRYVRELRRVLYITEFVMLVNYVEAVIPLIFSAYLFAMYHLPNRAYYELMAHMDDDRLRGALMNVLLYAALQIASLVALNMVLWHRLQISAFHQLAFVLVK
ncbi:hypothetical protein PHYSODRAFT_247670 [Phytophthora sojae]|uniref:Uncharacterized protein n=1 Tax=Phytophthora sojae (strain P6497) TaxID=1094619 RepID=G4YK43_PHYSP|nr:hypothetical protein PHYSODRAFT_247670 [Phytophthora sojae]EGZ30779.1 hypothetical protein PHYSODRAFT_247670 [Phytophthora sojae]|eukprot:XP_009518054.1 hypothetical protein PHYSODRAFT_247670 [Phytophthora sojae]